MEVTNVRSINRATLIYNFVAKIFPLVKQELTIWRQRAEQIPDSRLSRQAQESIRLKAFHCQGGSVYALYPGVKREETVRFIVAYQTMSDYLDNLVDSLEVEDELAFAQLHLAMEEALLPQAALSDYYKYYPYRDDGGYLEQLVRTCQAGLDSLPSYSIVQEDALELAKLYSHLQTYKHLAVEQRESMMLNWIEPYLKEYPAITAWEFAAATGSTLGIFCFYALSYDLRLKREEVKKIRQAYFPWICGLHILLDYFIDLREDRETGQLNFVAYYSDSRRVAARLKLFVANSFKLSLSLRYPKFERAVIQGLLAMYLSDEKSQDRDIRLITKQLLGKSGTGVRILYWLCRQLRKRQLL
ncbi:tetraprenyl-beta-curcumene synthase family protein [Desulfosporosinus sp. PR]|uniref:tetraprenyl-beta-curcumene synthase family protein n=1 Tax=Candidatus Desulfosporosinus nitrosoreducens TaxID=3401928 RepID=UPI0027ED91C7|nr:tetraprenyl-beta-curcumene synthase family protein [Desulfosporosinus sp. PR]MDQ7096916.1 tetraprenyl-beta-curcumene synthase family protein [Desulfosporosinus sp. PR]